MAPNSFLDFDENSNHPSYVIGMLSNIRRHLKFRLGVGMLIIFTLLVMAYISPLKDLLTFDSLIYWGEKLRASQWIRWGYFLVFMGAVLVFPITLFAVLGGIMFPFGIALPFNLIASCVGSLFPFLIARFFGRKVIHHLCKGRSSSLRGLASACGIKSVLLIRWMGVPPFIMANYALGLSSVRLRDYFWGTFLGILPWMALLTYASNSLWHAALVGGQKGFIAALGTTMWPFMGLSASIGLITIITFVVRRRKNLAIEARLLQQ